MDGDEEQDEDVAGVVAEEVEEQYEEDLLETETHLGKMTNMRNVLMDEVQQAHEQPQLHQQIMKTHAQSVQIAVHQENGESQKVLQQKMVYK